MQFVYFSGGGSGNACVPSQGCHKNLTILKVFFLGFKEDVIFLIKLLHYLPKIILHFKHFFEQILRPSVGPIFYYQ